MRRPDTFDRRLSAQRARKARMTTQPTPQPDPYECAHCGRRFVVPELARCCEEKHS